MVTILIEDFFVDKFQRLVYNFNNQASNTYKKLPKTLRKIISFWVSMESEFTTRKDGENLFLI